MLYLLRRTSILRCRECGRILLESDEGRGICIPCWNYLVYQQKLKAEQKGVGKVIPLILKRRPSKEQE